MYLYVAMLVIFVLFLSSAIRILNEYERGVIFRLGRVIGSKGPGLILLIPVIDKMVKVDLRVVAMDVLAEIPTAPAFDIGAALGNGHAAAPVAVAAAPAAAPPAAAAPAAAPAAVAVAEGEGLVIEPWIESARCTSCDECTNINRKLFAYNAKKQAYIKDPKAGSFKDLVTAAERCPVSTIHPGTPLNPKEKGLDKLLVRAAKFA